jgi:hypothetical protein
VMTLAPAAAHPGHYDEGPHAAAVHRHIGAAAPGSALKTPPLKAIALVSAEITTATMAPSAESDSSSGDAACRHGLGCCGTGCCSTFIVAVAPVLPLAIPVALARRVWTFETRSGVEPNSLLEPPNFRA